MLCCNKRRRCTDESSAILLQLPGQHRHHGWHVDCSWHKDGVATYMERWWPPVSWIAFEQYKLWFQRLNFSLRAVWPKPQRFRDDETQQHTRCDPSVVVADTLTATRTHQCNYLFIIFLPVRPTRRTYSDRIPTHISCLRSSVILSLSSTYIRILWANRLLSIKVGVWDLLAVGQASNSSVLKIYRYEITAKNIGRDEVIEYSIMLLSWDERNGRRIMNNNNNKERRKNEPSAELCVCNNNCSND